MSSAAVVISALRVKLCYSGARVRQACHIPVHGLMDDLQFYILFNSISVISGLRADDNERLCAMEPCLRLRRFGLELGLNPGLQDQ